MFKSPLLQSRSSFSRKLDEAFNNLFEWGRYEPRDIQKEPTERGLGIHKAEVYKPERAPSKKVRRKQYKEKILIGYDKEGRPIYRLKPLPTRERFRSYGGPSDNYTI